MRTLTKVVFTTGLMLAALPASASSIELLDSLVTGERGTSNSMTWLTALPASCVQADCRAVQTGKPQVISVAKAGVIGSQAAEAAMMFTASNTRERAEPGRVLNMAFARKFPDPAAPSPTPSPGAAASMMEQTYTNPNFDANGNPIAPSDVGEIPAQAPMEQASAEPRMATPNPPATKEFTNMELRTGG